MAKKRDNWTEEQITVVLYEYCRRPFGQFSGTKPFIEELGRLLHRSSGAIVRKVGNLAHFDPQMKARGVEGLEHTAKLDKEIWNRYFGHWNHQKVKNADRKWYATSIKTFSEEQFFPHTIVDAASLDSTIRFF